MARPRSTAIPRNTVSMRSSNGGLRCLVFSKRRTWVSCRRGHRVHDALVARSDVLVAAGHSMFPLRADDGAERARRNEFVCSVRVRDGEPLANEHGEDRLEVVHHRLGLDRAREVLAEQARLCGEDGTVVVRPVEQPLRPVLSTIDRQGDRSRRFLRRDTEQVVLSRDMVVQRGNRHAEVVGNGLEREALEPELVRGLCDHRAG